MLYDEEPSIKRKAVVYLGYIGSPLAVEPLVTILRTDENAPIAIEIKYEALNALYRLDKPHAVELSFNLYNGDSADILIKIEAASILAKSGNLGALRFLRECLRYHDIYDKKVRRAAYALAQLEDPTAVDTLIELIEKSIEEEYIYIIFRCSVLGSLFRKYPDIVKNALLKALIKGKINEDIAIEVIKWAAIVRNPEAHLQYLLKIENKSFFLYFFSCP